MSEVTITLMDLRKRTGFLMFRIKHDGESYIITSQGKPVARLVPFDEATTIDRHGKRISGPKLPAKANP